MVCGVRVIVALLILARKGGLFGGNQGGAKGLGLSKRGGVSSGCWGSFRSERGALENSRLPKAP